MTEYALYKGDALLSIGTITELANRFNVKPKTIRFYGRPAYIRRTTETGGRRLVRLEDGDDE